jgi:hypothetical protein
MRTYSFDHFKADKPEPSTTNPGGAEQTPPAEQAKHGVPPSEEGQLHYGRQHARTAELYHQRREERERAEKMGVSPSGASADKAEVQAEPMGGEAPPMQAREEPTVHAKEDVKDEDTGHEGLKGLAQQAVSSVLEAAREAAKGSPLKSARKLATGAVTGVFRVAREVSARAGKTGPAKTEVEEKVDKKVDKKDTKKGGKKGPGKKRQA